MTPGIFSARVIAPIHFIAAGGRPQTIPLGPCLIETHDSQCAVDIVWAPAATNRRPWDWTRSRPPNSAAGWSCSTITKGTDAGRRGAGRSGFRRGRIRPPQSR